MKSQIVTQSLSNEDWRDLILPGSKTVRMKRVKAWAIHTQQSRDDRYMGYIGVFYLDEWRKAPLHPQCDGIRTAIFRTRAQAREALKKIKDPDWGFKKARVYRVDVTIEGVPA